MAEDFGIKLSLPGSEVETAADTQLLFNSSWPSLKIFKNIEVTQTIPALPTTNTLLYNHGLNFVPAVIPYGGAGGSTSSGGVAEISRQNVGADTNNLYLLKGGNSQPINLDIRLSILYLDITVPFTAPVIDTGPSAAARPSPDFGFKISKDGKDVSSTDLRDFILHTSARSPMVHAVVPGTIDTSGTFTYTHDLPYNPIFFAFIQQTGLYVLLNGFSGLTTVGQTITIKGVAGTPCSIVILKDPFQITDNIINISL